MNQNLKISLPIYKIALSLLFVILLSLVRGISEISEIGMVMDPMVAFLAFVFCADSYELEYRERRWEIFELLPGKNRVRTIRQRLWIQCTYLWLVAALGYWFFYWQGPGNPSRITTVTLYGMSLFAIACSVFFWGTLSMTLVGIVRHLWGGIGITCILWLFVFSKQGERILGNANIFAFTFRSLEEPYRFDWMYGKWIAVIAAICMVAAMPIVMKKGRVK